jgi:uncharacterized protein
MNAACCPDLSRADELVAYLTEQPWVMKALRVVRDSGLPEAWVGAGLLRDVVWGQLHDGFDPDLVHDVDVGYLDFTDLRMRHDYDMTDYLTSLLDIPWECVNQASVHTWYQEWFGGPPVPQLTRMHDGVATGPETATSVAVRLTERGIEVCAPHGLDDLLDGVWRHNPIRTTLDVSTSRLRKQRVDLRWPRVTVVPPTELARA